MIVVIIVAVAAWLFSGSKNEEQIDFKQEAVTTQTLQNSVTATGTIEAVTSVYLKLLFFCRVVMSLHVDVFTSKQTDTFSV